VKPNSIKRFVCFLTVISLVVCVLPVQAAEELITVTGVLLQADDDVILDTGEKQMLVEIETDSILDLIGKTVIVTGSMDKDEKDRDVLLVEQYEVKE
jgi:hypothetical protein